MVTKTILLVDDSKFIRDISKVALTRKGYDVIDCDGPGEALKALGRNEVDLIITDIKMPRVEDGLNFFRELHRTHSDIPVAVFSADTDRERENVLITVGARAFMKKPMTTQAFMHKVVNLIGKP